MLNPHWLAAVNFLHWGDWRQFFQATCNGVQALGCWTSNAYQLYIRTPSEALVGISSQQAWHPVSLRLQVPFVICSGFDIAAKSSTVLSWACTAVNGVTLTVCCIPFVSVLSCFSCNCCSLVLGVVGVGSSISPLYAGPSIFKHQRDSGWMGGHSQGCHGYLLFMLEHCSAPPTL